ncbi:uncharacterized protein LOC131326714 isoform X2 [Rhododendron vialii]|uniref:uncharacterized protein LOC131326714 isoform X2 n=1 Tax=Rhododendron vialii TaxID=182163 RepID=UPI00265F934B|nr:uncharacterized protein LOC131326714 isoform X2 [Rhododendron vialii]
MLTRVSSTLFFLLDPDIQLKRSKTPIIGEVHLSNLEADVRCGKDVYLPFLKASEDHPSTCPSHEFEEVLNVRNRRNSKMIMHSYLVVFR